MGSFSEVLLSFDFSRGTPTEVLAAFSALASPDPPHEAPDLPAPAVEPWEEFEPDWRAAEYPEGEGDPFEAEPWRHDWASWVSTAMSVRTTAHGTLSWSAAGRWNLDCRFSWKTDPETASDALSWLAPFVDTNASADKTLVGYVKHDYAPRPHLFWIDCGRWELEDLNPNDDWMWG